jgi:hypothetical protein
VSRSREIAEAVVAWAMEASPVMLAAGYPHTITSSSGELPDVAASVREHAVVPEDRENFPFAALQQFWLHTYTVELSVLVEQEMPDVETEKDQAASQADKTIREIGDGLMESAAKDATLGERVQMTSPRIQADYSEPFIDRPDGVRGRPVFLTLVVADVIEEPG